MREMTCDVAVIGAGTAGIAAHRAAREAGAHAVLIERGPGGTTCARVGCMPSKLLMAAADAADAARHAGTFGVMVEGVSVDGPAVLRRVRAERDRFVRSVCEELDALPAADRIAGQARFTDANSLDVDDHTRICFRSAVIATGSSPSVPDPLKAAGDRVLTTDTLFEIADLPGSIAVIGAGPVGIEGAQALARLGVDVCLFDPDGSIGGLADPDLCVAARDVFGSEIDLHLGAKVDAAENTGDGVRIRWTAKDGTRCSREVARVLAASGRPPNLRGLGLDAAGLRLDERGSPAFDPRTLLCEGAPIFIAGDANAERPVLHEARRQGAIAGRNAAAHAASGRDRIEAPARWVNLAMVFTEPGIAAVGETYDPDTTGERLVGAASFADQGRARIMARNAGGMRIYADRAGRLLGAEMIGPDVEHLAHILAFAIEDGHDARRLSGRPFYHPTVEEALTTTLRQIIDRAEAS